MTAPAVAPYVPSYATRIPYITPAEFLASPTGVDVTQLVPGGTTADNAATLAVLIRRASAYADNLCYQVLAATSDVQAGSYRLRADGTIRVPVDYSPLIEVNAVSLGLAPGRLTPLTDLSGLWLDRKVVRIPASMSMPSLPAGATVRSPAGEIFAVVTYVNGYANTTLAASTASAATQMSLVSPLGVFPGLPLTIYDGPATEIVTVAPTYVQGSATVPLTVPLTSAHTAGVSVSALPDDVKQAVVDLTTHLIKTRGAEAVAMGAMTAEPASTQSIEPGGTAELEQAMDILEPFKRVW